MKHLAVLVAAALFSPVFAAPPKAPPTPKAPKAPKIAVEKGRVKAPDGEKRLGGVRVNPPPPPPPGGKAIVGPSDSSQKTKKASPPKAIVGPSDRSRKDRSSKAKGDRSMVMGESNGG